MGKGKRTYAISAFLEKMAHNDEYVGVLFSLVDSIIIFA